MVQLVKGKKYRFVTLSPELVYIGKEGNWHQFRKTNEFKVWSEILDSDLHLIEECENG